jgi:hypothetical protein
MCAFDLAWSKIGRLGDQQSGDLIPVTAFTFEAPRVGEQKHLSAPVLLLDENYCTSHRPCYLDFTDSMLYFSHCFQYNGRISPL